MLKPLNTLPIENFLEKARIATRSNQKFLNMDIKEVQSLSESLSMVMTRLASMIDTPDTTNNYKSNGPGMRVDGGGF